MKPGDRIELIKQPGPAPNRSMLIVGCSYTLENIQEKKVKVKNKEGLFPIDCFLIHETHEYHLTMTEQTMILNALHYYKKVNKRDNFAQFTEDKINDLRDQLVSQLIEQSWDKQPKWRQ